MSTVRRVVKEDRVPLDEFVAPEVDIAGAFERIWCLPHRFALAMPKARFVTGDSGFGGMALPDKTARLQRVPVGVCIGAGALTDLSVGDHVMVNSQYAKDIRGFSLGAWSCPYDVWLFGITSPHVRECRLVGVRHTAVAVLGRTEWEAPDQASPFVTGDSRFAIGTGYRVHDSSRFGDGRVLIELQSKSASYGMLHVPDHLADRPDLGIIREVSAGVKYVRVGDQVLYLRRGLECMYPEGKKNLAFAPEKAIYAVVREAPSEPLAVSSSQLAGAR